MLLERLCIRLTEVAPPKGGTTSTPEHENISVIIASGDMDTMSLIKGKKVRVYTLKKGIKDT